MRSRFLDIDYFSSPSSASYFSLSVPHLPPPPPPPPSPGLTGKHFFWFDFLPIIDVPLEINNLKIETALAKLLADVIPRTIDVPGGSFEPALSSDEKDFANGNVDDETKLIHEDKEAVESYRNHKLAVLDDQLSRHESKEYFVDKSVELVELVHFEIPELDVHLEGPHTSEREHGDIFFSGFSLIENDLGTLKQGVEVHNNHKTEESVYSFGYIKLENLMDPQADLVEDECSVQGSSNFHFPLLEVDDVGLENFVFVSTEGELAALLPKIEGQLLTQEKDFTIADEHISNFVEYALLESHSYNCPSDKCSDADAASAEIFLEIDFINIDETLCPQVNLSFYQGTQDGNQFLSLNPLVLEEFQILDMDPAPSFEAFDSSKFHEPESWKELLKDGVFCKSLDELVVSRELALVDDMFRSLPIPVLSDGKAMKLLHEIAEKAFLGLELRPLSASDDIYLDWHLLEEEKCSSAIFSSFQNLMMTIDIQSINFDWRTATIAEIVLEFVLSDHGPDELNVEECDKSPDMLCLWGSVLNGCAGGALTESQFGHQIHRNHMLLSEDNANRASSVFNSMSPFSDLDFFLNPSKSETGKKNTQPITNSNGTIEKVQSNNSKEVCESVDWQLQQKDFILHQVHLSDDLIAITENLKRSYLDILESNVELKSLHKSFQEADEFSLLSVSKLVFMDCIKNLGRQKPALPARDEMIITSATLCAIKQIAWYLCFYGIYTARSYLDKLCEGFDFFASRLRVIQHFLVDKDGQPDMEKGSSHPSLRFIQDILLSSTHQNGFKALVVADKVFCSALKMLLTSLGILITQLNESTQYPRQGLYNDGDFSTENTELLLAKVCLLASPENISADFPFNKFEMILEFGGSCSSSRINTLFPKLSRLPCLHFLKVEVNKSSAAQALCEGVGMPQQMVMEVARQTQNFKYVEESIDLSKLEVLLNFVPLLDEVGNSNKKECHADPSVPCEPFSAEAKDTQIRNMSFPELVIIMNTQSTEKEMIVSRRSTYQKILALEKMGTQVIERDSNLPADIIISPAACLVWYEYGNMLKKASGSHEASSWLPCHVENIATNILSFLSYGFSCCILIFEGENGFLSTVMETSDGLYAAAASLGVDLQIFCSYSAELTDEIILSCINIGTRLIKGLFPKLPESETLVESFLSKFPCINPLTAHSIVSNGGILADFLEWPNESRVNAVKKYLVPDESISLFSALCRYGEREDSQSIMTDTSSSVSSGPGTREHHGDLGSENKRCKYMRNPQNCDMPVDVLLQMEPAKQSIDFTLKFHEISKVNSWESSRVKFSDPKGCESSSEDFPVKKERLGSMLTRLPPRVANPQDCNLQKGALLPNSSVKHSLHFASVDPNLGIDEATISSLEWPSSRKSDTITEEVNGGNINLIEPAVFSPIDFSFLVQDMDGGPIKEPEYSFAHGNLRTFPTAAEIESSSCCTSPAKHKKYSSMGGGVDEFLSQGHNNETLHLKYQRTLLTADFDERSSINIPSMAIQGGRSNFRGTPLRDALHSSHLRKGSPWTMEFLNRISEKSKLRQQSLPPETSPCLSIRRNVSNRTKRRSPSILEFFKYQGGSTVRRIPEQKRQKTTSQSLGSFKNEKASSVAMSCTPADKRARRKLSYTTSETGSQTRLVWSERNTYNQV